MGGAHIAHIIIFLLVDMVDSRQTTLVNRCTHQVLVVVHLEVIRVIRGVANVRKAVVD